MFYDCYCEQRNFILACLVTLSGWGCLPGEATAETPRKILKEAGITPNTGKTLPLETVFTDHTGQELTIRTALGQQPTVLCLVYFDCPMLCKLSADGLVRAANELPETVGEDYRVLLVSFNPQDTPEKAARARQRLIQKYDRTPGGEGWSCLTGSQSEIDRLTGAVGFKARWDEELQQYAHASGLVLLSGEGVITGYLDGVSYAPRELSRAIDAARQSEVTQPSTNSFLTCYLYDPTTGRLGSAVQWAIRILGGLTLIGLVWLVWRLQQGSQAESSPD
ncbi:SCO family protein [Gimesia chilikensis]|uniref:SCO family protein n=1 Tax=Gimesia chilikensis TaxID=2605989 RepID=UPI0011EF2167|nr:SCO family protein [Gimesia chilikensis]KAA0131547.1 SCO family protein [Gimesia chilikensis]